MLGIVTGACVPEAAWGAPMTLLECIVWRIPSHGQLIDTLHLCGAPHQTNSILW